LLSLIILAYNDGKSLQENVPAWIDAMRSIGGDFELIIADDGSFDSTEEIAKNFLQCFQEVKYVRSCCNKGVGANFRLGIQHATGDIIAYTDGDGQYLPSDLPKLWKELEKNDMVTGKRTRRADPFTRTIASTLYNRFIKMIYRVEAKDINSGLKIFRREFINNCGPQLSDGPFFDAEYMVKGYAHGMKIKEVAIAHRKRKYGKAAGVSRKSVGFTFREICNRQMSCYVQRNYLSRIIFKLLAIQASFSLSIS
jgi:glycosyltransferase involved in cell wall biosynthesis